MAAELAVAAAAVTAAKSAPQVVAEAVAMMVAEVVPGLRCLPYSALPPVVRLDQCFAAVRPSLDSSR